MNQRYKTILMWGLYALLFLAVLMLQSVIFGRLRFFGVKLNLLPVVLVAVCVFTGHEAGGLFSLIAAFIWYATGADDGSLSILTLTVSGILAGFLCNNFFSRSLLPTLLLTFGALLLHEAILFFFKYYLGAAPLELFVWVPLTACFSELACPVLYLLAKAIRKVGGA